MRHTAHSIISQSPHTASESFLTRPIGTLTTGMLDYTLLLCLEEAEGAQAGCLRLPAALLHTTVLKTWFTACPELSRSIRSSVEQQMAGLEEQRQGKAMGCLCADEGGNGLGKESGAVGSVYSNSAALAGGRR